MQGARGSIHSLVFTLCDITLIGGRLLLCRFCCCLGCAGFPLQGGGRSSSTRPWQLLCILRAGKRRVTQRFGSESAGQNCARQSTHQAGFQNKVGKVHEFGSSACQQLHALQLRLVELRHVTLSSAISNSKRAQAKQSSDDAYCKCSGIARSLQVHAGRGAGRSQAVRRQRPCRELHVSARAK